MPASEKNEFRFVETRTEAKKKKESRFVQTRTEAKERYLPTNTIIFSMIGTSTPETFMLPVKPDSIDGAAGSVVKR